jgi:hypothetical protein
MGCGTNIVPGYKDFNKNAPNDKALEMKLFQLLDAPYDPSTMNEDGTFKDPKKAAEFDNLVEQVTQNRESKSRKENPLIGKGITMPEITATGWARPVENLEADSMLKKVMAQYRNSERVPKV